MPDKWVTLQWFLFGVHPYQPTLDFTFLNLEWTIVTHILWCYIKEKKAFKLLRKAIKATVSFR